MAWSPERRMQHRLAMERIAERDRCEVCGRKSALKYYGGYVWCWWTDEGKCTYDKRDAAPE